MTQTKGQDNHSGLKGSAAKSETLLPPAKIHLFSDDLDTLNLFQVLGEDWRFGRINMGIRGDSLDEAIEHYSRRKSPTLIIIQTETLDKDFEIRLEGLSEVCGENTAAIIIGPTNDVQLYRRLTAMGISDYLVAPIQTEDLVEAIANSLQQTIGSVDSHLMAMIGVKGGVGTTSLSTMMADILSNDLNVKTLILDAAGAQSTLWNHYGFSPSGTLIEAARAVVDNDTDALNRLIIKKSDSLHILNTGTESILDNPIATQAYEMLLDYLLTIYPYVIVDTSSAPTQTKRSILTRANSVGIIATPKVSDLSLAKLLIKSVAEMPGNEGKRQVVFINKSNESKSNISNKDIHEALGIKSSVSLNWDSDFFTTAENNGEPLTKMPTYLDYKNELSDHVAMMTGLNAPQKIMQKQLNTQIWQFFNKLRGRG